MITFAITASVFLSPLLSASLMKNNPLIPQPTDLGSAPPPLPRPCRVRGSGFKPRTTLSCSLSHLPWRQPCRQFPLCPSPTRAFPTATAAPPGFPPPPVPPDRPPRNGPSQLLKRSLPLARPRPLCQPSRASSTSGTLDSATQLDGPQGVSVPRPQPMRSPHLSHLASVSPTGHWRLPGCGGRF